MNFSFLDTLSASIVLFAVIDILGSLPIVMALRESGKDVNPWQATSVALAFMLAFMFLGEAMLGLFGVDLNSFAVAGAFVIFIIGLEMILGVEIFKNDTSSSASIVPLAFPLLAGPGTFTTLLSLRAEYDSINVVIALILNMVFVFIILRSTSLISKLLGTSGIFVLKKFFGIILLAISVRLFTSNLAILIENFTR